MLARSVPQFCKDVKVDEGLELQRTKKFVEFVGGVEIGFEFAGANALAKIVEAAGEQIQCSGEDFAIGQNDIAPSGVRAACEAQRVAKSGTGESDGQAILVEAVLEK
jgi:hypothetical protein